MTTTSMTHPILELATQLGLNLRHVEEVARFRAAEKQIEQSETVNNYIDRIKQKQKELVHAKHFQKTNHISDLEEELERLNQEFDGLPIVQEYQQMQLGINDLLQTIQHAIATTISHQLEISTGGEVPSGCGSGGPCGCSGKTS